MAKTLEFHRQKLAEKVAERDALAKEVWEIDQTLPRIREQEVREDPSADPGSKINGPVAKLLRRRERVEKKLASADANIETRRAVIGGMEVEAKQAEQDQMQRAVSKIDTDIQALYDEFDPEPLAGFVDRINELSAERKRLTFLLDLDRRTDVPVPTLSTEAASALKALHETMLESVTLARTGYRIQPELIRRDDPRHPSYDPDRALAAR